MLFLLWFLLCFSFWEGVLAGVLSELNSRAEKVTRRSNGSYVERLGLLSTWRLKEKQSRPETYPFFLSFLLAVESLLRKFFPLPEYGGVYPYFLLVLEGFYVSHLRLFSIWCLSWC